VKDQETEWANHQVTEWWGEKAGHWKGVVWPGSEASKRRKREGTNWNGKQTLNKTGYGKKKNTRNWGAEGLFPTLGGRVRGHQQRAKRTKKQFHNPYKAESQTAQLGKGNCWIGRKDAAKKKGSGKKKFL